MAAAAQDSLILHQACRFLGVAAGAGYFSPMLLVGCLPTQALLFVAKRAGFNRAGNGMVPKGGERNNARPVWGGASIVMAFGTGRRFAFRLDAMGDQHFGIGLYHGVTPGQALLCHAFLNGGIKFTGHKHPDDGRWDHLAAFVQRHNGIVSLDRNNGRFAIKRRAVGFSHVINALGVR